MRFNRGKFNRSPFNRSGGTKYWGETSFAGRSLIDLHPGIAMSAGLDIISSSAMQEDAGLKIYNAADYDGLGFLEVLDPEIEKILLAAFNAGADTNFRGQLVMFSNILSMLGQAELNALGAVKMQDVMKVLAGGKLTIENYLVQIPEYANCSGGGELSAFMGALIFVVQSFAGSAVFNPSENLNIQESFAVAGAGDFIAPIGNQRFSSDFVSVGKSQMIGEGAHNQNTSVHFDSGSRMLVSYIAVAYDEMQVDITLNPGDVLIVDSCNYTATLNGENVLELCSVNSGDWIKLVRESMEILVDAYGDSELDVKVEYTPRWK